MQANRLGAHGRRAYTNRPGCYNSARMKAVLNGRSDGAALRRGSRSRDELLAVYRCMLLSRKLDDKEIQLKNQSQIFFQISGAGHEAVLVAAGLTLQAGLRLVLSRTTAIARSACSSASRRSRCCSPAVGAKDDPGSGGRQMPSHWGHTALNIVSGSSPTGTQVLHAVGAAEAGVIYSRVAADSRSRRRASTPTRSSTSRSARARPAKASSGKRSTPPASSSCRCCSWSKTTATRSRCRSKCRPPAATSRGWSDRFPGLHVDSIDGTDFFASLRAMREAAAYVRARKGPAFVHARVHPSVLALALRRREAVQDAGRARGRSAARSDRALRRVPAGQRARDRRGAGGDRRRRRARGQRGGAAGARRAEAGRRARADAVAVLARRRSDVGRVRHAGAARRQARHDGRGDQPHAEGRDGARPAHRRLRRGRGGREPQGRAGRSCPGKGGVFKLTHGLQRLFGDDRVFNSPLAEANIVGRAIGMATRGLKPVVEIQFFDYIWPAMMQIRDELTMMRYRSGNHLVVPDGDPRADRRLPARRRAVPQPVGREHLRALPRHPHRVSVERRRRGRPAAHRDPLRRSGAVPRAQAPLPPDLQQGRIPRQRLHDPVRQGEPAPRRAITCWSITWGALVQRSLLAAQQAEKDRISVAVLDLRTIVPYDWEAIAAHVKRTNRVVIAHEDQLTCGFGAEIAARIAGELFEHLDAPVRRVGALQRAGRLLPGPRGSDPAAVVRHPEGHPRNRQILTAEIPRRSQSQRCFSGVLCALCVLSVFFVVVRARAGT